MTIGENGLEKPEKGNRLGVLKTYKLYIGGQFPRTESGRYYIPVNAAGLKLANICLGSRKDFRNAVVAARSAFGGWSGRAAFNRGQILYRIAEMLEGRKAQFIEEMVQQDATRSKAEKEGHKVMSVSDAVKQADIIHILIQQLRLTHQIDHLQMIHINK